MLLSIVNNIFDLLEKEGIEYMLTGGYALRIYTSQELTSDVDIVINPDQFSTKRFISIIYRNFHFNPLKINKETRKRGMFYIIDKNTGTKIYFIIRKETEYRITEFNRRRKINTPGFEVWIVSIEDLIISKLIKIQEDRDDKQIEDIRNLLENPSVDYYYIQHWCIKLDLKTFGFLDYE